MGDAPRTDTALHHSAAGTGLPRGPWRPAAEAAGLLRDGVPVPTVFEEMTGLARTHDAVNLGQGFPDTDGPEWIRRRAAEAVLRGEDRDAPHANQYAPGAGLPALRAAVAHHQARHYGLDLDPQTQVVVSTGATEGIAAALLALLEPGDEVVVFEPFYDSYTAVIALAGAVQVTVPLHAPDFLPDPAALEEAITARTRLVMLNTPHNPIGAVYSPALLEALVAVCSRHGLLILSDEVYEHLVYEGRHTPVAAVPGAAARTLTVSSAGKSLSLTGWKVGWVTGPAPLISAVRTVKQYLTYSSGPAYQLAVAEALEDDRGFLAEQRERYRRGRDLLVAGLQAVGLEPIPPAAGYFTVVDLAPLGVRDGVEAARRLTVRAGLAAVPVRALCRPDRAGTMDSWIRVAFCKRPEVLQEAVERLGAIPAALGEG